MRGEDAEVVVVTGTITTTTTGSTPLVVIITTTTIMGTTEEEVDMETGTTTTRDRPGLLLSITSSRCNMVDSMKGTRMEDVVEWPTMEVEEEEDSGTITVTKGISPPLLSTTTRTIHSIIIRTASKALQSHKRTMSRLIMTSKSRIHPLLVLIQWLLSPVVQERATRTWTVPPITAEEDDTRIRHGTRNYQLAIRKSRKS